MVLIYLLMLFYVIFQNGQFSEYQKKMGDFHKSQKSCLSTVNLIKRKIKDFDKALKRYGGNIRPVV